MKPIIAIMFVALLPLSRLPAQHRDTCTPTRQAIFLNQYQREYVVKQHLMQCAFESPTENLWREIKNVDPFVRWAASTEINRRWHAQKAMEKAKKPVGDKTSPTADNPFAKYLEALKVSDAKLLKGIAK